MGGGWVMVGEFRNKKTKKNTHKQRTTSERKGGRTSARHKVPVRGVVADHDRRTKLRDVALAKAGAVVVAEEEHRRNRQAVVAALQGDVEAVFDAVVVVVVVMIRKSHRRCCRSVSGS